MESHLELRLNVAILPQMCLQGTDFGAQDQAQGSGSGNRILTQPQGLTAEAAANAIAWSTACKRLVTYPPKKFGHSNH